PGAPSSPSRLAPTFPPPLVGGGRRRGEPRNQPAVLARSLEFGAEVAEAAEYAEQHGALRVQSPLRPRAISATSALKNRRIDARGRRRRDGTPPPAPSHKGATRGGGRLQLDGPRETIRQIHHTGDRPHP